MAYMRQRSARDRSATSATVAVRLLGVDAVCGDGWPRPAAAVGSASMDDPFAGGMDVWGEFRHAAVQRSIDHGKGGLHDCAQDHGRRQTHILIGDLLSLDRLADHLA